LQAGTSAVSDKLLDLVGLGGKSAADKGKDTRDYLAAAFPELNAWERAGADASSAGMVDAGFENQKELTKMQLDNQKEIAEMQNETQKEIAGIQSATSRQNTKDQVYAQNEMLAYQQKESTARVASIMENTNLSKQQQVSEIMRQMLTQAQTAGQYFTNDQIKEMTFISKRRISGMALLILALLQRIFLMSSLMLLLVWLIFFMVLIKLLPILGTISGKTVKLMVLALICLGNNRQD